MDTQTAIQTALGILVRHAATTAAGALATWGVINGSQTDEVVGAIMLLAGVALSGWNKYGYALVANELAAIKARRGQTVTPYAA